MYRTNMPPHEKPQRDRPWWSRALCAVGIHRWQEAERSLSLVSWTETCARCKTRRYFTLC